MSSKIVLSSTPASESAAEARRQAFVDVARELFFANGYAATAMSSIASAVGGSKTTLWTYFPSKEALFTAVLQDVIDRYATSLLIDLPVDEPVPDVLHRFGIGLLTGLLEPTMLSLYRLVVAEAERLPGLAEIYYNSGPRIGKARLAAWMSAKMEQQELRRGDALQASHDFVALCHGDLYPSAIYCLEGARKLSRRRISEAVDAAVDTFCRAWELRT